MERKDTKASGWGRNDSVELTGNGREAELIVAGLRLLAAQVAVRDTVSGYGSNEYRYPTGTRDQRGGFPLRDEVDLLLGQLKVPNYVEVEPTEEVAALPEAPAASPEATN